MSDKTKTVINNGIMYVGFISMIGSIIYNFIVN